MLEIELEALPPSVNNVYRYNSYQKRMYMTKKGKIFIDYTKQVAIEAVRRSHWKFIEAGEFFYMEVRFEVKNNRFADPNNLLKVLIDSFEGIVFENDKWLLPSVEKVEITGRDLTVVRFKI